ncbi:hypothetical protein D3C73_675500 [compost metagenome]
MVLGELVDVVPGSEAMPFRRVGIDRNLDQVLGRQQVVEQAQLHGRNHVLGIVQDEAGELDLCIVFKAQDGVDHVVQAVSLAGRTGTGAHHFVHVGIMQAHRIDVGLGLGVVGVGADENLIVLVVDGRGGQARHFTDHADFVPRRHHDRQGFFADGIQPLLIGSVEFFIDPPAPDQLAGPVHQVDEQVIEAEYEHQQGQGNREVFETEQHIGKEVDKHQAHTALPAVRCLSQMPRRLAMRSLACPSP